MDHKIEFKDNALHVTLVISGRNDEEMLRALFSLDILSEVSTRYFAITQDRIGISDMARLVSELSEWDATKPDGLADKSTMLMRDREIAVALHKIKTKTKTMDRSESSKGELPEEMRSMQEVGLHKPVELRIKQLEAQIEAIPPGPNKDRAREILDVLRKLVEMEKTTL